MIKIKRIFGFHYSNDRSTEGTSYINSNYQVRSFDYTQSTEIKILMDNINLKELFKLGYPELEAIKYSSLTYEAMLHIGEETLAKVEVISGPINLIGKSVFIPSSFLDQENIDK